MASVRTTARNVGGAGVIACCVAFTPIWEGMDSVAKRDRIGTGHPITYCNGLTSADGAVKIGQRFTKAECDKALAEALPKYWAKLAPCIFVPLPDKTAGSLLDAAWNAGPAAVCRSPMLAKMNAGNLKAGCNAFSGWYVRSDGQVRAGLVDRRNGEDHGDKRLSEKGLCLEGLREGLPNEAGRAVAFTAAAKNISAGQPEAAPAAEIADEAPAKKPVDEPKPVHHIRPKPVPPKPACTSWLWNCG